MLTSVCLCYDVVCNLHQNVTYTIGLSITPHPTSTSCNTPVDIVHKQLGYNLQTILV